MEDEAVRAARANAAHAAQRLARDVEDGGAGGDGGGVDRPAPVRVEQWDATALPLADGSVDVVLSDLPWGVRELRPCLGRSTPSLRKLYPKLLRCVLVALCS